MEPNIPAIVYQDDSELDFIGSVFRYPGRAGQAVRLLKYHRRTALTDFMARKILEATQMEGLQFDIATAIPIHWFRLASRGFNQADLLSSGLSSRQMVLRRVRATKPQAGLTTSERLKNLEDAFEVIADVQGKTVLLIDDVVTSGQTARECAKALRLAGATSVGIVAFAGDQLD